MFEILIESLSKPEGEADLIVYLTEPSNFQSEERIKAKNNANLEIEHVEFEHVEFEHLIEQI